jgi:peptidyl-prolyl cis-trans isomerase SurA
MLMSLFFCNFSLALPIKNDYNDFVVVKVNNKIITQSQVEMRLKYLIKSTKMSVANSSDLKLLREQIIDKMIDEELIRQDAQKFQITVDPEDFENNIEIIALQKKLSVDQFKIFLKNNQISFEVFSKYLEAEILRNKIISELFLRKVKVSDIEILEFLEQGKSRSDHRKFLIAEIVISNANKDDKITKEFVEKIFNDLNQGADFLELVRQFSNSSSALNNGLIGWVSQGDIDARIYSAIANLNKNNYSKPIILADGYHIFKLLDAKVEKNIDDNQSNIISKIITKNKLDNLAKGYLIDLRKKSFVEIQ